ncbi:hypothetical protein BO78DRAFT_324761, partial [Aspergillus sclerotiicarbonarius CBS 121057]
HTTTGCGEQGFPSAQPYLSHTPGANPFCCMFFFLLVLTYQARRRERDYIYYFSLLLSISCWFIKAPESICS